jgi:uncharacterized membrane protein YgcG
MDLFNRSGARLKLIAALNLEPFANRAVDDFGLKPEDTDTAMREYRHFLYLAYWNRRMEQSTMVVPTVNADKIWHSHILFTRDYREMCDRVFGRYLDHQPGLKEGTSAHTSAMQHTRDVHKRIRELGKDPGFDESYFAFLDPKPVARPRSASRAGSRPRSRGENAGGNCSSSSPVIFADDSPPAPEPAHSSHDFGGGSFGGGGASHSWGSDSSGHGSSSSSSDSGGSSSDSGGGGGGCGGGGD